MLLAPLLTATHTWGSSISLTLSDAAATFAAITATADFSLDSTCTHTRTAATLLIAPDYTYQLNLLPSLAGRRSQRPFSLAVFRDLLAEALLPTSPLTPNARIAIEASKSRGATAFLINYYIPRACSLTDPAFTTLLCNRFRLRNPALPPPPAPLPTQCRPKCPDFPLGGPKHFPPDLVDTLGHFLSCTSTRRLNRHDDLVNLVGSLIAAECPQYRPRYERRFLSSSTAGSPLTITDLFLECTDGSLPSVQLDPTISNEYGATNRPHALRGIDKLISFRATAKSSKHAPGVLARGYLFYPLVITTLGALGPPATLDWIDSLFAHSAIKEKADGGNGSRSARRRILFYQTISACLARGNHRMFDHYLQSRP